MSVGLGSRCHCSSSRHLLDIQASRLQQSKVNGLAACPRKGCTCNPAWLEFWKGSFRWAERPAILLRHVWSSAWDDWLGCGDAPCPVQAVSVPTANSSCFLFHKPLYLGPEVMLFFFWRDTHVWLVSWSVRVNTGMLLEVSSISPGSILHDMWCQLCH